ncbi:3-oxo-5-alpha-steroid 4-dehydrogenase 1, partial [Lamprotornis superbus]
FLVAIAKAEGFFYRALIFPLLIRAGKPTPFFTFVLALLFCVFNGYLQGRSLTAYAAYPPGWLGESRFITGWLIGMAINIHSDHILRNLRKPGETGGMFEYVSGANFFGEILEWFGFALACCTIESFAFALCSLFILGSRARQHHKWYLEKFEDYPKDRKIDSHNTFCMPSPVLHSSLESDNLKMILGPLRLQTQ